MAGVVEEHRKLGPSSQGTRTKINNGRVRIHKDFPLTEVLRLPPISHLWPREDLRHSHCRTWIFLAVSQTVLPVPKAESGRKPFVRKRCEGDQRKGPSIFPEAINPICKPILNKPSAAALSSLPSSFSSSHLFHRGQAADYF